MQAAEETRNKLLQVAEEIPNDKLLCEGFGISEDKCTSTEIVETRARLREVLHSRPLHNGEDPGKERKSGQSNAIDLQGRFIVGVRNLYRSRPVGQHYCGSRAYN